MAERHCKLDALKLRFSCSSPVSRANEHTLGTKVSMLYVYVPSTCFHNKMVSLFFFLKKKREPNDHLQLVQNDTGFTITGKQ